MLAVNLFELGMICLCLLDVFDLDIFLFLSILLNFGGNCSGTSNTASSSLRHIGLFVFDEYLTINAVASGFFLRDLNNRKD